MGMIATFCFNKLAKTNKPTWSGREEKLMKNEDLDFMFLELDFGAEY